MKLMIDISDSIYEAIMARDWKNAGWLFSEELKAIHDGTPIPENATNGDMIKALFPCKYEYEEPYTHGIALAGNGNRVTWFVNEWWNAPYKRGEINE